MISKDCENHQSFIEIRHITSTFFLGQFLTLRLVMIGVTFFPFYLERCTVMQPLFLKHLLVAQCLFALAVCCYSHSSRFV